MYIVCLFRLCLVFFFSIGLGLCFSTNRQMVALIFSQTRTRYGGHHLQKTAERGPRRGGQPSAGAPPGFPAAGEASHREAAVGPGVPGGGSVFMSEGDFFLQLIKKCKIL